jgi:hypothetical protein
VKAVHIKKHTKKITIVNTEIVMVNTCPVEYIPPKKLEEIK